MLGYRGEPQKLVCLRSLVFGLSSVIMPRMTSKQTPKQSGYLVFARKYRPQTFDEVVGQQSTLTTLKNAIASGRIPQSFIFSGSRGVGKTSVARILAKALNATGGANPDFNQKDAAAREIEEGRSMDVLEIDGASNRGIEEIRSLRETVKFKPASGSYKIYIIDEVHMLTTEAFNALLKTLEEPPSHVKFIFATTEIHKVPLTILSRCQRFHFRRLTVDEIVEKLAEIAKVEKVKCEKDALYLIARASDGALRDAESLLDQLASFSDGEIKEESVLTLLGLASDSVNETLLEAVKSRSGQGILSVIQNFYESGGDLLQLSRGFFEILRHLLVLQHVKETQGLIEAGPQMLEMLQKYKKSFNEAELLLGITLFQNLQADLRRPVTSPRFMVEAAFLKLIYADGMRFIDDIVADAPQQRIAQPAAVSRPDAPSTSSAQAVRVETFKSAPVSSSVISKPAQPPITEKINESKPTVSPRTSSGDAGNATFSIGQVEAAWPRVIETVKSKRMSTGIFLSEAEPVEVEDSVIILGLPEEFRFHKESLEKENNKKLVEECFSEGLGGKARVRFVVTQQTISERPASRPASPPPPTDAEKRELPDIITQALDVFDGAKIIRAE